MIVSVVIPTRNRRHLLEGALASLEKQEFPVGAFEVIVANDGSRDDTAAWLASEANRSREYPVAALESPGAGAAAARNAAISVARGAWLAFFDDDCLARPGWLGRAMRNVDGGGVDVVGGLVVNVRPSLLSHVYQAMATDCYESRNRDSERPTFLTSNNLFVRREALEAVGGFSERFRCGGEDRDLLARLVEAGYRARYDPGLVVEHRHEFTLASYLSHHRQLGRGTVELHRAARRRGRPMPCATPWEIVRMVRSTAHAPGEGSPGSRFLLALLGQAAVAMGSIGGMVRSPRHRRKGLEETWPLQLDHAPGKNS